ncbi:hypothetical protein WICMUC_003378 [Wickerhamomyces mucosus]|uniref:E3 ubiquitin ligase complex SCF subunit n=1 Tax=Wickerhamomyces mucosus TaxID=1378264 RepID=A0A9P8PMT7_9ASCO|nr:hypothetical protein WICMUC_003378 [Wickerhamomyces mucosus]
MSSQLIKITTSDEETFKVERSIVERSVLLKHLLSDLEYDETDEDAEPIPLPNVRASVFKKVLEWAEHHKNTNFPDDEDEDARKSAPIDEWDREFLKVVDQEMLYEIILAANYLNIRPLLDAGCKTVAEMIRGKSAEEIRRTFNIVNDFSPEEEAAIKRENEWAEDR